MKKSILSGILALSVLATQAQIFTDPMESSANWTINADADTTYAFGWDYSTLGIPEAPNSQVGDVSTRGLRMGANISSGVAQELSAVVSGLSMGGYYTVSFDFWANVFVGDGASTEFIGGGIGMNGGDTGRDGASLLITGEGGSSRDWRLYKNDGEQFIASLQYNPALASNNSSDPVLSAAFPGQTAPLFQQTNFGQSTNSLPDGTPGFGWHQMLITVDSYTGLARFEVDGLWIGTVDNNNGGAVVDMTGGVGVIYSDLFSSVSGDANLSFGVFDNFVVVPEPTTLSLLGIGVAALLYRRRR